LTTHFIKNKSDFVASSAFGAESNKIGFLKARLRRAFKKPIKNQF
jgi:hypothetical protein